MLSISIISYGFFCMVKFYLSSKATCSAQHLGWRWMLLPHHAFILVPLLGSILHGCLILQYLLFLSSCYYTGQESCHFSQWPSKSGFSKCSLQASTIYITWELVGNSKSWALAQIYWIENRHFNEIPKFICVLIKSQPLL